MQKRGQAALEYLVTYGWVFVAVLVIIGTLSYFGFLSPDSFLSDSCDFGLQLECVDQYLDDEKQVVLRFQNNFGANITIVDAYIRTGNNEFEQVFYGEPSGSSPSPVAIPRNEIRQVRFDLDGQDFSFSRNRKQRVDLIVEFHRVGGSIRHNITGNVFGEVSEPLI